MIAKTWENVECAFFTGNTENAMGDSKYLVLSDKMTRTALINLKRAPDQVYSENPAIAYLEPNGGLYKAIMGTPDDVDITIASVGGDRITVRVNRGPIEPLFEDCNLVPANGLSTFDFKNNGGVLSRIHVGHTVKQLNLGRPRRGSI